MTELDTLHDPKEQALFPELPPDVMADLPNHGTVVDFADGDVIFREGERNYPLFVVVEGRIRVTKQMGAEQRTLAIHGPRHFTGEIAMLTGGPAIATGVALGPTRVVRIENDAVRKFIGSEAPLAKVVAAAIAGRAKEVEAVSRQQDKLAALGKLSAGLAHELNNPASAAKRAAQMLRDALEDLRVQSIQYDCRFSEEQRTLLQNIEKELHEGKVERVVLDALERSDLEQELSEWLEGHNVAGGWELAPTLADAGFTVNCLNSMHAALEGDALCGAITWLEKSLRAANLASELQSAASRVSELVAAMKEYTYMDRADFQQTDVHRGLDSTLTIFAPRFKKTAVKVERRFDPNLPLICAHPGELNQVWTNLIDNALDAMAGKGALTISTWPEEEGVAVEIADTGPGIPAEFLTRIYEPFFTTKPVGEGTGLGLDIVYRIVRNRHGGTIRVNSVPGDTRFVIRLPKQPPTEEQRFPRP